MLCNATGKNVLVRNNLIRGENGVEIVFFLRLKGKPGAIAVRRDGDGGPPTSSRE